MADTKISCEWSVKKIIAHNYDQMLKSIALLEADGLILGEDSQPSATLLRKGSNHAGKPLQHGVCAFFKHSPRPANEEGINSWACVLRAAISCPDCKLVMYCGGLCMEQHIRDHVQLCKSRLLRQPSDSFTQVLLQETSDVKKEPHVPTLSNPPLPVYGLLQDRAGSLSDSAPALQATCSTPIFDSSILSSAMHLPKRLRFFFPCAYDLRNVLLTVCQIPENYKGRVTLIMNSAECILAVRDLLILELLWEHGADGIDAAIALWFSAALTAVQDFYVLKAISQFTDCSEPSTNGVVNHARYTRSFTHSSAAACSVLRAELNANLVSFLHAIASKSGEDFQPSRQYWAREEDDDDRMVKLSSALPAHLASWTRYHSLGLLLPFGAWNAHVLRPNRLRYSASMDFIARYRNDVISGWNIQQLVASGVQHGASPLDLYGCLFFHLRDLLKIFLQRIESCRIQLHVTQFKPERLADLLQESGFKFHRIDACPFAYYKLNHRTELSTRMDQELPEVMRRYLQKMEKVVSVHPNSNVSTLSETVSCFGRLLEKDASAAWPSLLLTASLNWASKDHYTNLLTDCEEYKCLMDSSRTPCNFTDQSPYTFCAASLYRHYALGRFPNMMCCIKDLLGQHFSQYVKELNVDEDAKKMTGLERKSKHRVIPSYCIEFMKPRSGNIDNGKDFDEEKAKVHYFNLLFSGFTFLEQFQEWGWQSKEADPPSLFRKAAVNAVEHDPVEQVKNLSSDGRLVESLDLTTLSRANDDSVFVFGAHAQHNIEVEADIPAFVFGHAQHNIEVEAVIPAFVFGHAQHNIEVEADISAAEHDNLALNFSPKEASSAIVDETLSSPGNNKPTSEVETAECNDAYSFKELLQCLDVPVADGIEDKVPASPGQCRDISHADFSTSKYKPVILQQSFSLDGESSETVMFQTTSIQKDNEDTPQADHAESDAMDALLELQRHENPPANNTEHNAERNPPANDTEHPPANNTEHNAERNPPSNNTEHPPAKSPEHNAERNAVCDACCNIFQALWHMINRH